MEEEHRTYACMVWDSSFRYHENQSPGHTFISPSNGFHSLPL